MVVRFRFGRRNIADSFEQTLSVEQSNPLEGG